MSGRSGSGGFTLVEILLVIGIVVILFGLLFPAWTSALERGRESQCLSNMRQIHVSIQGYLADHGGVLMQRFGAGPLRNDGYDEALMPYLDPGRSTSASLVARKLFTCPSQPSEAIQGYPNQPGYGLNWFYDNTAVTLVERPSQTILLAETLGEGSGSHRADRDWARNDRIGRIDSLRHRVTSHYLFFDGHVARLSFDQTTVPIDPALPDSPDMWGTDFGRHGVN